MIRKYLFHAATESIHFSIQCGGIPNAKNYHVFAYLSFLSLSCLKLSQDESYQTAEKLSLS